MAAPRTVHINLPPTVRIDLSFTDLTFTVPAPSKRLCSSGQKTVLKGVSGKFKSGELTAIMGPSGAGKSSLLNILTGFQREGMAGRLMANDMEIQPHEASHRKQSAYIMQDDHLDPLFTILETMTFAASLKIGPGLSTKAKQMLIEQVLDSLGMTGVKDVRCCRLSGGQRKRLSIALELIDNPPILFLDEPTTGLDSSSSLQLVSLLRGLAIEGRTIVCTIHQPSATVFNLLDHVYIVGEGQCLYQGSPDNLVPFLQSIDLPCPVYHNPADFIMDVVSGEFGYYSDKLILANNGGWRLSTKEKSTKEKNITELKANGLKRTSVLIRNPSEWSRYGSLISKIFVQFHRDWTVTYLKLGLHMTVAGVVGAKFSKMGDDADKVISNLGFMYVTLVYLTFTSLMPAVLKFPTEVKIIQKENFNNWYKFRTYYLAFMTINIPVQLLFTLAFVSVTYVMTDQIRQLDRYLLYTGTCFMTTIIAEFLGLSMGAFLNPVNGVFFGSIVMAVMLSFGGFLVFLSHMPTPLYYVSFGAFFRYSFELLNVAIYGIQREDLPCHNELYCHLKNPKKIIAVLGMQEENAVYDVVALSVYILITAMWSYFRLKRRLKYID